MLLGYNLYDMYGIYWHKRSLKLMEDVSRQKSRLYGFKIGISLPRAFEGLISF